MQQKAKDVRIAVRNAYGDQLSVPFHGCLLRCHGSHCLFSVSYFRLVKYYTDILQTAILSEQILPLNFGEVHVHLQCKFSINAILVPYSWDGCLRSSFPSVL